MARALVAANPRSLRVWTAASMMRERVPSRVDRAMAPLGPDFASAVAPITVFDQLLALINCSNATTLLEAGDSFRHLGHGPVDAGALEGLVGRGDEGGHRLLHGVDRCGHGRHPL